MLENDQERVALPAAIEAAIFVDNERLGRFELWHNGGLVSFAEYYRHENRIVVPYVETAVVSRVRGYATALIEAVLAQVRSTGGSVSPVSPFVANHIRVRPEHHDLVIRA